MLFNWNMSPLLLIYQWHLVCLINCCGVNSTHTVHQGILCCFTLYIAFLVGILARHSLSFSGELFAWLVSGGAAVHRPNVLWSTPPIQKSTTGTTWITGIPIHVTNCPCLTDFKLSAFTLYFSQKHCTGLPSGADKCGDHPIHQRCQEWWYFVEVLNSSTSMGVGFSLYMRCAEVEQVGPDQPENYLSLCLRWFIWLVLGWLGWAVLSVSLVGFPVYS